MSQIQRCNFHFHLLFDIRPMFPAVIAGSQFGLMTGTETVQLTKQLLCFGSVLLLDGLLHLLDVGHHSFVLWGPVQDFTVHTVTIGQCLKYRLGSRNGLSHRTLGWGYALVIGNGGTGLGNLAIRLL